VVVLLTVELLRGTAENMYKTGQVLAARATAVCICSVDDDDVIGVVSV
jgi:hypothetical protein